MNLLKKRRTARIASPLWAAIVDLQSPGQHNRPPCCLTLRDPSGQGQGNGFQHVPLLVLFSCFASVR